MKIKTATGKDVYPIKFAGLRINMVCSGIVRQHRTSQGERRLVKRFMSAPPRRSKPPRRTQRAAAQSILDANPKGARSIR